MISTTASAMKSAIASAPSLLIAMMRATAAGTAGGRNETGTIALTGTIAYTTGWIEDMIAFTIALATRTAGVIRGFTGV